MKHPNPSPKLPSGFALVVTVSLMVILVVLAVGLLTLSTVSLKTSALGAAEDRARANAKMALMMAIGELQKYTGADTRITASSQIIDQNCPPLVGVWKSWEGTDHSTSGSDVGRPIAPDYSAKQKAATSSGRFIKWLVSGATEGQNITTPASLVFNTAQANTVPLLAENSLEVSDSRQIHITPIETNKNGRYAWWVSGENQKACLAQPYSPRNSNIEGMVELGQSHPIANPEAFGLSSLLSDPEPYQASSAPIKAGRKAMSRQTMSLVDSANTTKPQNLFHDLTNYSTGLLTNTATGGWRKDLSLLTENWDAIYASYPGGKLPLFRYTPTSESTSTSQVPKPTQPSAATPASTTAAVTAATPIQSNLYPWSKYSNIIGPNNSPATYHAACASWQSLVSYATTYRNLTSNPGAAPSSPFVWDMLSSADAATPVKALNIYNYEHVQRLHPQIARFQFLVMARAIPDKTTPSKFNIDLLYVPIFTLWNPFNVGLTYTIPNNVTTESLGFGWQRALPGVLAIADTAVYPSSNLVPNTEFKMFTQGNFQYLDDPSNDLISGYDLHQPENTLKGYNTKLVDIRTFMASLPSGPLNFKPGETKIFSPDGTNENAFGGTGMRLELGYQPSKQNGYLIPNIKTLLPLTKSFWFLLRTDKFTKPYKSLNSGFGFTLSFGKSSGAPYNPTGTAPLLHKGVQYQYVNQVLLSPESLGKNYWPSNQISELQYSVAQLASKPWTPICTITAGPRMTIGNAPGTAEDRPTKGVLQSNPISALTITNPANTDGKSHPANGAFELSYSILSDTSNLTPSTTNSEGYICTGCQKGDGLSRLIIADIPLRPIASLIELQGWNPRGNNPYPPFQCNLIGNSDATPLIPQDSVIPPQLSPSGNDYNLQHDDAYCANHLLFDDWFASSIAPQPTTFGATSSDIATTYKEFLKGNRDLTNRCYRPIPADSNVTDAVATTRVGEIITSNNGWLKAASRFEVSGMFNVNSTSVEAWKALLGRAKNIDQIAMQGDGQLIAKTTSKKHVVTRGPVAPDTEAGSGTSYSGQLADASEYTGYRSLSDQQIQNLAEEIVKQVRLRGPFLSLSEFINRQLSSNKNLALAGAVQSALNALTPDPMATLRNPANDLSSDTMPTSDPRLVGVGYQFADAATGSSAYGAPGWIRQADILRPIAPVLSARDDTFTIRAYGDSLDEKGKVTARAWCEAVVKRTREFCDKTEDADSIEPPSKDMNKAFGRRYEMISFKWLNSNEI